MCGTGALTIFVAPNRHALDLEIQLAASGLFLFIP
jgi:hypothetical protein